MSKTGPLADTDPLRVALVDMWRPDHPMSEPVTRLLTGGAGPTTDNPRRADVVVHSVYGRRRHLAGRGIKVCVSNETQFTAAADYTVDCRHIPLANHLRVAPWAWMAMFDEWSIDWDAVPDSLATRPDPSSRRFCNFVYSNWRCRTRNAFFEALHAREPVDALGAAYNNTSDPRLVGRWDPNWQASKLDVLSDYKFTIAFENQEMLGYTTEKMVDAWLADTVPIYWGNPAYCVDFPAGACLSLYEAGSFSRLVDQVLEAHHDPDRYEELRSKNPFRTGHARRVFDDFRAALEEFTETIAVDARERRRSPRRDLRREVHTLARRLAAPVIRHGKTTVRRLQSHEYE